VRDQKRVQELPKWPHFLVFSRVGLVVVPGRQDQGVRQGFHSAKLCIVAMPLILVAMVGVSLVDDYRHHWQDVFTAGVLRLVVVSFCYLQFFPPLSGEQDSSFIPTSSTCLPLKGRTGRGLRRGNRTMLLFSGFKFWNCYLLVSLNPVEKTLLQTCEK